MKKSLCAWLVISLTVLSARAGWEYTAVTKAEGGKRSEMMGSTVKALVEGNQAKMEFVESGNPMMSAGSYLLLQDAGKRMLLVNPQEKTYTAWDMSGMMGMAGGVMSMMNTSKRLRVFVNSHRILSRLPMRVPVGNVYMQNWQPFATIYATILC